MKDLIQKIKYERDKISPHKLELIGFKYDDEDNLFYNKNHFRAGYSELRKAYQLFYGSYSNNFGYFVTMKEFQETINYYLKTKDDAFKL